jgi:hypothetical protein
MNLGGASRRERTKGRGQKGEGIGHVLTNLTSRVTVTDGAKVDAALGEWVDGLEHGGRCARTGGW